MRLLLASIVAALLCLGAGACGGTTADSSRTAAATGIAAQEHIPQGTVVDGYLHYDEDAPTDDGPARGDDAGEWSFGRAATPAEQRAFATVLKAFYAAAAAGDGAAACAQIAPELVRSADPARTLPPEYSPQPGSALSGGGCARVESLVFSVDRPQFAAQSSTLRLLDARVNGVEGLAILGFRTTGERMIALRRVGGAWKLDALLSVREP